MDSQHPKGQSLLSFEPVEEKPKQIALKRLGVTYAETQDQSKYIWELLTGNKNLFYYGEGANICTVLERMEEKITQQQEYTRQLAAHYEGVEISRKQEILELQEEIQKNRKNAVAVGVQQQAPIQIGEVQNDQLSELIEDVKEDIMVSIPGSQVSHYHFGADSTTYPDGYRFKIPNSNEFDTPLYLYHQICGDGHFERSDGKQLNIVQMFRDCFMETKNLRRQFKERIDTDNTNIADFANGLQS